MSIEIILVRHATAFERDRARWPDDRKRPLSPEGKEKFRKAATGLTRWLPDIDCVLTSPLTRARETAEILEEIGGWPQAGACPELAPQSSPTAVLAMLKALKAKHIALIGHEPNLSALLSVCVAGSGSRPFSDLKKGGIACLAFPTEVSAGKATLNALVPPRALRRMG
jgi:phosphohistidine phosphatase